VERAVNSGGLPERIVAVLSSALERRLSRRGALARAAVAGSAVAVAPVRYLVRPGTAWAVIRPDACGPDTKCNDGFTVFCCEIEHGRNICPADSYVAGWWKCTDYRGKGLCHDEGVRYYLDCNRVPGHGYPGGCQCGPHGCNSRRVSCNLFRYGQCNTHVAYTTEVVCRLVICEHPATVQGFGCNSTEKTDDRTCSHEAGCLEGLLTPLPGGGGA
jgi:hypothetical protein